MKPTSKSLPEQVVTPLADAIIVTQGSFSAHTDIQFNKEQTTISPPADEMQRSGQVFVRLRARESNL